MRESHSDAGAYAVGRVLLLSYTTIRSTGLLSESQPASCPMQKGCCPSGTCVLCKVPDLQVR